MPLLLAKQFFVMTLCKQSLMNFRWNMISEMLWKADMGFEIGGFEHLLSALLDEILGSFYISGGV
jgi:hypothetical protein